MSEPILGVDIAKRKFDAALLINGKLKHKVFTNSKEDLENCWPGSQTEGGGSCPCLPGSIKHVRR